MGPFGSPPLCAPCLLGPLFHPKPAATRPVPGTIPRAREGLAAPQRWSPALAARGIIRPMTERKRPWHQLKTQENLRLYLDVLKATGNRTAARESIGASRRIISEWLEDPTVIVEDWPDDLTFKEAYDDAVQAGKDAVIQSAREWGMVGINKPLVHQGQITYKRDETGDPIVNEHGELVPVTIKERSEGLMRMFVIASDPETFGNKVKVDADVRGGGVILAPLAASEEEWARLAEEQQAKYRGKPE